MDIKQLYEIIKKWLGSLDVVNDFVFGSVDLSRYTNKTTVSIIPDNRNITDYSLDGTFETQTNFTITFIFQKDQEINLLNNLVKWENLILSDLINNSSLNNKVIDTQINDIKYYTNLGNKDKQIMAIEFNISIDSN